MAGRGFSVLQLYHAWINSILNEEELHITTLTELQDGAILYRLFDILSPDSKDDQKFQAAREKVAIQRVQAVLDLLYRNGVKVSVGAHEILQGDTKALLDVLWGIILNFFIHTPERPPTQRTVRVAKRNLLDWCKQQQPDLSFNIHASLGKNFGKSDALARIINTNCRVEKSEELVEYLSNAVSATEDQLGISKDIINPVDIIDGTIDEHALLVYLALIKRKSQLKGTVNGNNNVYKEYSPNLPNGLPEVVTDPVLLNTNDQRRSPSPKAASPRINREPSPATPHLSLLNKVELDVDDNPITFEVPSSSTPRSPLASPRRSPIHSPRHLSPDNVAYPDTNIRTDAEADLVIDLTDSGQTTELFSPRNTALSYSPPYSPRRAVSPQQTQSSPSSSPHSPRRALPQQTQSSLPHRSQSASPQRSTTPQRTQSPSPQRSQSSSPQRIASEPTSPPSPRRTVSPPSSNINHVYSPRNTSAVEPEYPRSPLGSPGTPRRQKAPSPLGSPRTRSPRRASPNINGYRGMNGIGTMDPSDRLDLNGFDEKGIGNLSDGEQPNSARSGRTDTSDWLSSSSGSVNAYNVTRGKDDIIDSGVDTEIAEAIKNKVSEHFEIDSQQNTPRVEDNFADTTLTETTGTSGLGMSKSMSNDDLLTMLEAIGHQGKTLRDELISREQELMLMQVQTDDPVLGLGLVEKYEQDVEYLRHENELLSKEVASAKSAALPEREIVNTLLTEIHDIREKMDVVETQALSPRDDKSPRLDLDSGFKESVKKLSSSMDSLDQKLGVINTNSKSMDSLTDRSSLYTSSPETKPPSGAFKHAELRWQDQEKALKEQISAQRRKINELESMVSLTKNENKELQRKLDKASTDITNRVNMMDAMISETQKETEILQTENDELKEHRKKDKQNIKKMEEDMQALEKKIGALQRENSNLTDQLQASMKKSQASENNSSRLEALVKENTFIKEKLVEAEDEKKRLQLDVMKYLKRCREVEGKDSRDPSPSKPAPVVNVSPPMSSTTESPAKQSTPDSPAKQSTAATRSQVKQSEPTASRPNPGTPAIKISIKQTATSAPVADSSPKRNPPKMDEKRTSSPTKYLPEKSESYVPVYSRAEKNQERPNHEERKMTSSPTRYVSENGETYVPMYSREGQKEQPGHEERKRTSSPTKYVSEKGETYVPTYPRDEQSQERKRASSPTKYMSEKGETYVPMYSREEHSQERPKNEERKRASSPTKYVSENSEDIYSVEDPSPERPNLEPSNRYQHHERIMIKAKQAMQEAEYDPTVKEKAINLAELSRKYPELDRYSHKTWAEEKSRKSPEHHRSFDDVVERVSAVSKTLDTELEKSRDLYHKMQTPKVTPISRARLRSDESTNSSERPRSGASERQGRDSDLSYSPTSRRRHEERPESSRIGHRRTHSASGGQPETVVKAEEPRQYRTREYGSLQNLSSKDRTPKDNGVDHRNRSKVEHTVTGSRPPYRSSSADRLAIRQPPERASQGESTQRSMPHEPETHTPVRSSDIRNILQKRFGSAPLPPRMSAAMRGRKPEESTPTRSHYGDSRSTGQRGSAPAPVRVIHTPSDAVHQEQYQRTPKAAWGDENGERMRERSRGQEPMPRRRMYNDEPEPRPSRTEDRGPVGSRHGSGPRYRDHTPKREPDRYGSPEQFDARDSRQPPTITVTPPEEQKDASRPRQYRRFSGSGPDSMGQREEDVSSPVSSRDRDGRPPVSSSGYHKTPERQHRQPERQPTTRRSQTPQRTPAKQPQENLRERHPSSPSKLRGQGEQPSTQQQDMYEKGQLVNWRDVARDYGVDVNDGDDYPYFGVVNDSPQTQQSQAPQYKDYDNPGGQPVVTSSEVDYAMDANGVYRDIPEPSTQKAGYQSHRRAQSLDGRQHSTPAQSQKSYGQYNGDPATSVPPPASPLKGNPSLRDSPTHRSASSISQMSSVSRTEQEPPEGPVFTNAQAPPKLSAAQIAYVDSLIEKYTRT